MKKIIVSVFVLGCSFMGFSQQVEKENKVERMTVVKGGEQSESTQTNAPAPVSTSRKLLTPEQELKSCENQLSAINKKEAYLKANPEQLKLAQEDGWFEDAAVTKAALEKRIKELKLQLKK